MSRIYVFIISASIFLACFWQIVPPFSFPSDTLVTVKDGVGLFQLSEQLKAEHVIRSPFWFRMAAIVLGGERDMKAGQYYLRNPENTLILAWRIFHGRYDVETIKVTIPEGFTSSEIANLLDSRFSYFDQSSFLSSAPEGYLFPDTYFVPINATASTTISLFTNNFNRKISGKLDEIQGSGHSLDEVVKMASILESEGKSKDDKEIISDILWKRLALNMPLQVDSDPDTYKHAGFPPQPISNPGLESIDAAIHPTTTPYLYFLTGDDGAMHYSITFDEHVAKKLKYIKK